MGSEELSLSWDDHHNTLVGVFEELLDSSTLVDCTIAAEGQYLKAHKVVLSACSPYFQMLFSQENEKNPIVILKDIKFTELKSLIDFVYRGKVKLQRDQLENFVAAAESLQIKGLASQDRKKGDKSATKSASKMAGCSSPIPHKRRRSRPSSPSEDDVKVTNADTGRGSDNNVLEHSVVPEMPVDVHQSSSAGTFLTSLKDSNSHPHSSRTNHERRVVETKSRQRQSSSPEVLLPDADPVIKTEPDADPEPITEIFVEEPKDEEYLDDMNLLESEDGNADTATGSMGVEQSTNQYSIFTPVFDATDDSYLVSQMQEQSGAQDISTEAELAVSKLSEKSKYIYEREFMTFCKWRNDKKVGDVSEEVLLAYFNDKAKSYKSSSLWSYYSMLRATLLERESVNISKYSKLIAFLKQESEGYKPKKSKTFTKRDFYRFLKEARDEEFLLLKVVMIMGVTGACRIDELCKMTVDDVQDRESVFVVKIPDAKIPAKRMFTIVEEENGLEVLPIVRKYASLRPPNTSHNRFFVSYRNQKCTVQPVGRNTFGKMPMMIATFLKLPNANEYTGYCFRQSSESFLVNSSAD